MFSAAAVSYTACVRSHRLCGLLTADVTLVVLTDIMFFLTSTNQKLNFYSHDNKVGCCVNCGFCC